MFTVAPCDEVPGVGELAVTEEKRRLFAEPGDGELNLSITDGPVGDNKGSDKKKICQYRKMEYFRVAKFSRF